jgi:regulator of protease activity HflC (stomatin/prohibitin superfamily)
MDLFFYFPLFLALLIFASGIFTVKQQSAVVVERFGKFQSIRTAGLNFKIPVFDKKSRAISLKINQLDVNVETKTSDDVFVGLKVSVQFVIIKEKVYDAYYRLENPREQINAYVFDVIRAEVPKMKLDDVFMKKDDVANAIKHEIEEAMSNYGYKIIKALVTDIDPDAEVKKSMNHINAAERQKVAAEYEAEAERIRIVARAKAEAESKRLQGQGIADQRREIARGLEESVEVLNKVGINSQEASALIVVTQHYDTLQSMGENVNSNLVLLPNSPASGSNMLSEMVTSFTASQILGEQMKEGNKLKSKEK